MGKWTKLRCLFLSIFLVAAGLGLALTQTSAAQKEGIFTGTWNASGNWQPLDFVNGREVFTFRLSGHVNLKDDLVKVSDFWAECVGLWDADTGGTSRCVWRQPGGKDEAYLVLKGQIVTENVRVNGEFVGGTGSLQGLEGSISFTWWSVFRNRTDRILTGYTEDLQGSYQVSTAAE